MASLRCPICGRPVDPDQAPTAPFCGLRCRQVDLGRWLDERYSLDAEPDEESPEQGSEE